jgi:hypothetical protein
MEQRAQARLPHERLALGFAELPLRALRAIDRDLANVSEEEAPELVWPRLAAALGAGDDSRAFRLAAGVC